MATITKGKTFTNGELVTPASIHQLVDAATISGIVNADISASAAIADTKLAQISTANKVANSATSATSANTANAIVARDGSGNFSAGTITAALSGNAATATTLQTARTINGVSFNGSANITITADPNAHTHGNITNAGAIGTTASLPIITGTSGVLQAGSFGTAAGTFCQGNDSRLSDARTPVSHTHDDRYYTEAEIDTKLLGLPVSGHTHAATDITSGTLANARTTAASTSTANAIVARDASGNFSAGTITAALSGNATTATTLQTARTINGVSFNGSANITITADPNAHTHDDRYYTETEVNTLLAGKQNAGSYAASVHTHAIADTTGLQSALDSKLSGSSLGLCKAWVNFNHSRMLGVTNAANGESIAVTAGSSSGTWNSTTAFSTGQIGIIYYIISAGAVPNASLGGINVSTLGFQIRAISGNTATIKLLAGPATTSQTISGDGGTSGFQYMSYGIRAQYGISSITKAASGSHMNFTFNFSTPFDFIDYFYQFQMDARSSGDFYIQAKGQSSIQIQVLNFSDASVSSQMNFMAMGN